LVLVVDDDDQVRTFIGSALADLGFSVIEAADAAGAISAVTRSRPDMAILDYAMPGTNGAEVADQIRRLRSDLPIIFATGYADTEAIETTLGTNATVLRKPFMIGELNHLIQAVLADRGDRPVPDQRG